MRRKWTAISRLERTQTLTPAAKQRIVIKDALRTEQALNPVGVLDALGEEVLPLSADPTSIFLVSCRRPDHKAHPRLAALLGQKGAHQRLAVDPIRLRLTSAAGGQNRRRVNDVTLAPFARHNPMYPEAVQPGLLNGYDRKAPVQASGRLLLELGKPSQQAAHVARRDRMPGQLLPRAGRQRGDQLG